MGLLGDLLSLPVKILNVPARVADEILFEGDKTLSKPGSILAKKLEEVDEKEDKK